MKIKTETIRVTFRKQDGSIVANDCVATLHKADHKTYGNGTSVTLEFGRASEPYLYDTRYVTELWNPDNFGRWVRNFIADEVFTNVINVE